MPEDPTRRQLLGTAAALAATLALPVRADAAEAGTTLTLSSWLPPTHPIVTKVIVPWAEQVSQVTDGRVRVRVLASPLGSSLSHYELAEEGVADITYGLHSYRPSEQFILTRAVEFPFLANGARELSVAYWKIFREHLAQAAEHEGTHVLSLFTHGPGQIHSAQRPIRTVEELQGLKFRVPGGMVTDLAQMIGMNTLQKPTGELYELLLHGVADGLTITMEAMVSFNLYPLVKQTTTFPGGFYNLSWFFVMNEERWNRLSEEDRAAIDAISGEAFARRAGEVWDEADAAAIEIMSAAGHEFVEPGPDLLELVGDKAAVLEEEWVGEAAERGVDGKAVLAALRATTGVTTAQVSR